MSDMKIRPYYGEFLVSPWPLHMDLPPCGYNCAYCFAKLKRSTPFLIPDRTEAQWRVWLKTRTAYLRSLIERKSVICVSNTSDPFSPKVHDECRTFMLACLAEELPLTYQTRGGPRAREWAASCPRATWYVSITSDDQSLTDKVESVTPAPRARTSFVEFLVEHGHRVIVGLNPYIPHWWRDIAAFFRWAESLAVKDDSPGGIVGVWTQNLHLPSAFKNDAYHEAWERVQPIIRYARKPLAVRGKGMYPLATHGIETTLPVMGDHNAPLESVAAMWDDAVEPYEESSVYPTLWQWLDQFEIGSPVLFDDFVSEIAAMTSPAACSQNKCYLSSKRARGKGAPIRAYTVREALEQIWDDDSHGIWLTPYMAVASSNGAPVEYLDHKLGVRTIGSKEWLEPLNNGVELET